MPTRPTAAALLVLALLAFAPPASGRAAEVDWDYVVDVTDPASGKVDVEIRLSGLQGVVTQFCFDTRVEYAVTDVLDGRLRGCGNRPAEDGVYVVDVDEDTERFRFTVDVRRTAPGKADEYASWLDADGGVLKAEAFALRYEYSFYCGRPVTPCPKDETPVFETELEFRLPDGWAVEGPWARAGDGFALPRGESLPQGFFAVGAFETVTKDADGRSFRYARLGDAPERFTEQELFNYLEAATPYFASVYGDVVGDTVFVVTTGDPMFNGGLAGHDSLFVHETADLRTVAHEYAHVWQVFSGKGVPGEATVWVNEGDAEYHGTLSLFATGDWSLDQVNAFFREADRARDRVREPLTAGVYGHDDDVAYKKGLVTIAWLDRAVRENSDGALTLNDLLQALNRLYTDVEAAEADLARPESCPPPATVVAKQARRVEPIENCEVLLVLNDVVGRDFTDPWARYVLGTEWPPFRPVDAEEELALVAIEFTPEAATPGEEVVARIVAENRGLTDVKKTLAVTLDGVEIGTVTFDLPVDRRSGDATINFTAPEPGTHRVKVGYLGADFQSLRPASFALERVSVVPATPRAGETASALVYVTNAGEAAATAKVRLAKDGEDLGERLVVVSGGQTVSATWEVLWSVAGASALEAELLVDALAGNRTVALGVDVLPADRDRDGAPDDTDAFPDNPGLQTANPVGVVQDKLAPGAGVALAALAVGVAAAFARKKR